MVALVKVIGVEFVAYIDIGRNGSNNVGVVSAKVGVVKQKNIRAPLACNIQWTLKYPDLDYPDP